MNRRILSLVLFIAPSVLLGMDNAHFYKPARLHGIQSRVTDDWFAKIDATFGYGSARRGYDLNENKSSVLNIHGNQNLLYLTTGVPKLSAVTTYFNLLALLINQSKSNPSTSPTFGHLEFTGKFNISEFNFDYRKPFTRPVFTFESKT